MDPKKRKRLAIMVGLGAAGFIAMEVFLPPPGEVQANPSVLQDDAASTTTDDDSAAATPGTSSATRLSSAFEVLRNQLEGSESEVAEVFGPPAPTRASISNEQVATTEVEQGTPSLPELTSFSPAAGGLAVLDGRVVRVGGQVGDFVLRAVTPQGVVLQLDDRTFELTLE